jgi:hypothetical protein
LDRSGRLDAKEGFAGLPEALADFGEVDAVEGGAGDHYEVEAGWDERLVGAKDLAHTAFGAVALDGVAHGGAGGDHPDTRTGR